jgi:hypothetical protein
MPRNPWSARGMPLVRRPQAALSSARSPDAPAGMPSLARECLLQPPQPDTLHVAQAGAREGRRLGIRIAEPRLRLSIGCGAFREHTFSYEFTPGGRTGPDVCGLVIAGPTSWRSPNSDQSAELIAADLTSIRDLTSLAA